MLISGPTVLFFQENAGSILIFFYSLHACKGEIVKGERASSVVGCLLDFIDLFRCTFWCVWPLLYTLDIAHRLEFVRIMLQKLHCNVFMLSY